MVQGVGFRPFVYRVASDLGLKGWVENRNNGVLVVTQGSEEQIQEFTKMIEEHAPEAASIESIDLHKEARTSLSEFEIRQSSDVSASVTEISPDIAVCKECLNDMRSQVHRINYPLINCTHCGPRFSIIRELPYDRPNTTMQSFEMCAECRSEYSNISDRRFHAQPVACNHCGPVYSLDFSEESVKDLSEILSLLEGILGEGGVVAMKGTGGFHLVCNAFSTEGVSKLRQIKQRDGTPFALMF